MANPHTFDYAAWQALFPALAATPEPVAQAQWDVATIYLSKYDGLVLKGETLQYALNLFTAHLVKLNLNASTGASAGVVTSAGDQGTSVGIQPPPMGDSFQYWLSSTPYGLQLRALFIEKAAGGFYVGGSPERSAFRSVGGRFR